MKRAILILGGIAVGIVAAGALALMVFTHTDRGREFVRSTAVRFLNSSINGQVSVGGVEGNVLGTFALTDVVINDSAGAPFSASAGSVGAGRAMGR
jgi:autotransporter translocation and assembly factor TamB